MIKFIKNEMRAWRPYEVAWLFFCEAVIISLSLYWKDSLLAIVAAATGIAYTIFAGKGKISCFLFGLVNTPLYAYLAWDQGYFGDMTLNVYYFLMMFPGIVFWRKNMNENAVIKKCKLVGAEKIYWGIGILFSSVLLWWFLSSIGGSRPLCDALTNVLSIAAMILTVKRCIEQWIMWTAVNLIEIFMWWKVWCESGNSVSLLLMWTLFLVNGIYLFSLWIYEMKKEKGDAK